MRIRDRSIVILASQALTQLSTIVLAAILVRMISQELFGTYRQVLLVSALVTGLVNFQIEGALFYFLPRTEPSMRRRLMIQAVVASFLTVLPAAIGMYVSAGWVSHIFKNPGLAALLKIWALYLFPDRVLAIIVAFFICIDRAPRAGMYSLFSTLARTGTIIAVIALGHGLLPALSVTILAMTIVAVVGSCDVARVAPTGRWGLDSGLLSELLRYAWPLWGTAVVAVVNLQLGNAMISAFFDPATFALYACGAIELPVVALITGSMNNAVMPNLVSYCAEGRVEAALILWHEAARKCALFILPCFAFCLVVSEAIVLFLYGAEYARAAWPFTVYLFVLPLRIAVYSALLRAINRTGRVMLGAALALAVNLIVSCTLLVLFRGAAVSFIAPAIGAVVAQFVSSVYLLQQIVRSLNVQWRHVMRWGELGAILGVSLACGALTWAVGQTVHTLPATLRLVLLGFVYSSFFLLFLRALNLLRPDELELLRLPIRMLRSHRLAGNLLQKDDR